MSGGERGERMRRFYRVVMVLTDQYPPQVTGGAELSLHAQLKDTTHYDTRVVVVTLDHHRSRVGRGFHDGLEVVRVPFREHWPAFVQETSRLRRYRTAFGEYRRHRALGDDTFLDKARLIAGFYRDERRGLGVMPMLDRQALILNPVVDELRALVSEIQPDVIHADNYRSIVLASALGASAPVVSSVRDNRFFCAHRNQAMNIGGTVCNECAFGCVDNKVSAAAEPRVKSIMAEVMEVRRAALQASAEIVVTSRFLEAQVREIAPGVPVSRVPNITEAPAQVAQMSAGVPMAIPPEVLCVGMIGHNKGQLGVVNNLEILESYCDDFRMVFAGRGGLVQRLGQIAADGKFSDRVHFAGFLSRDELYRCYARASVVICPNVWPEPFGRVPLEAGLARKPVVATDTGGIAEQIRHEETGLVVPAGDVEGLLHAAGALLADPQRARAMGEAGYAYASARHEATRPGKMLSALWARHGTDDA